VLEAALWGFVGASALVVGAEVAFRFTLSRMTIGLIMAFGIGTLVFSIALELVEPALDLVDGWMVGLGLAVGALTFFLGDRAIARMGGANRKNPDASEEGGDDSGMGIALGSALDGIPESAALGIGLPDYARVAPGSIGSGSWRRSAPRLERRHRVIHLQVDVLDADALLDAGRDHLVSELGAHAREG